MTAKELANKLNGRQMGNEITAAECSLAADQQLVVVFGYSDDCVELCGAIHDEVYAYDGKTFQINSNGVLPEWDDIDRDDLEEVKKYIFNRYNNKFADLKAQWGHGDFSWAFSINTDYETFEIYEDDEPFCLGIVFHINDLPS